MEVINAGVGAANSREEAFKIKYIYKKYSPDLFIIYDGWNDAFSHLNNAELDEKKSRLEEKQSKKHPLQLFISKTMQSYRTPFVLYPIFSHHYISLSLNDDVYQKNSEIWSNRWSEICKENNENEIKTVIILQPVVGSGDKKLSPDEKHHAVYIKAVKTREQLDFYSKTLPIELCSASFDLTNAFDNVEKPIFYDGGHMIDLGNEIIANKIYEKIVPIVLHDIKNKTNP